MDCDCDECRPLRVALYRELPAPEGIYLDHAATTPMASLVFDAMRPYLCEGFGNPSSIHGFGRHARVAVEDAREKVARCLGAQPPEICFTSGGTESDNTVLIGVTEALAGRGDHVITSAIEHHAILDTCHYLASRSVRTTVLPVDEAGLVDPEDVRRAITGKTVLVSIMHANNEVGTVQPVEEIGHICREAGVLFHTDAVQSTGSLPVNVDALNVDFLSLSAHKFYGPKGVGVLYARTGAPWNPTAHGGGQEGRRRAGTENVAGIVGLATALELAVAKLPAEMPRLTALRDRLVDRVLTGIERCRLNGHPTRRLPNNAHFSIEDAEGPVLLMHLDMAGIAVSTGSACTSGSLEPSHVLTAIHVPEEYIRGSVRFSLGRSTTAEDVDYAADTLAQIAAAL